MKHLGITNFISFEMDNDTYKIYHVRGGCEFYVENDNIRVCFIAEGKNGSTYTKTKSLWNKNTDRCYTAERYLYKYTRLVSECGYILAKNDYLCDYEQGCPLSETREKALKPYYEKCETLGLSANDKIYENMNVSIF